MMFYGSALLAGVLGVALAFHDNFLVFILRIFVMLAFSFICFWAGANYGN